MKTREQEAGELYSRARDAVMEGGVRIGMVVNHIITMIRGWDKYPEGHLWRDREVPPEGKVVHLDRFEDYLLRPAREGLGFSSLLEVQKILEAHNQKDDADIALSLLRQEIPDYDAKVAGAAVARVPKAKPQGAPKGSKNASKNDEIKPDNIRLNSKADGYGTSKPYITARLKRDADTNPQARTLLKSLEKGELSARKAAVEMGYVKVATALDTLQRTWKKASADEQRQFLEWISNN